MLAICGTVQAENYLEDYGYYDNTNEISAKDGIMDTVNNLFSY